MVMHLNQVLKNVKIKVKIHLKSCEIHMFFNDGKPT